MIIVNVTDGIDKALKQYKAKVTKTKQITLLQECRFYKKKSVTKRHRLLNTIYRERLNRFN